MTHVNGWAVFAIVELTILLGCAGFSIWFWGVEGGVMPTIAPPTTEPPTIPPTTVPDTTMPDVTTTVEITTPILT